MIDSHCHLNSEPLNENIEKYIQNAKENGVKNFLVVGWDLQSSKEAVEIANKYESCYAAVGIIPSDVLKMGENDLEEIDKIAKSDKVIAIGEIGLDYYWHKDPKEREIQKTNFIKQIKLANKLHLPVSIHSRDACEDTYNILKENKPLYGGVMHCYSYSKEMVKKFEDLGLFLSFSGTITYKNNNKTKEAAIEADINKILIETDSPYLSPVPHRGETNEPALVSLVLKEISLLKDIEITELDKITTKNFMNLFHVKTYED